MVTHVVLLQPRPETTEDEMRAALSRVTALHGVIPGLVSARGGRNQSDYHRGFTYGVIMLFADEAALRAHFPHPAHLAVVAELDRLCAAILDFDLG